MREACDQFVCLNRDHGDRVMENPGGWILPFTPEPRKDQQFTAGRKDGAGRSLLHAGCLWPFEPRADWNQTTLVPEGICVEPPGRELVGAGIEGEVLADEGTTGRIRR